eukprot:Skav215613  [mRNA]  locus=scaffold666:563816:567300:- [translate_table: standard]
MNSPLTLQDLSALLEVTEPIVGNMSIIKSLFAKCAGFSGGIISGNSEFPQFLILGLDKSGKTTLLYRLKIGSSGWPTIKEDMEKMRTPELNRFFSVGVWEVPGTEAMRHLWKLFYHSIKIHCVIFVVDGGESEDRRSLQLQLLERTWSPCFDTSAVTGVTCP